MPRDLIYAALAGIAFTQSLTYSGGYSNLVLLGASILLLGGCCYRAQRIVAGDTVSWGRIQTALAAYLVLLVALVYTSTLAESSIHFTWVFAAFVMVFFLTMDFDRNRWVFTFSLFALTGLTSALWGLGEFLLTRLQTSGPLLDPTVWATIGNLFFFATVSIYLSARHRLKHLALLPLLIFAAGIFAAASRAGMAVFVVALVFSVLVCSRIPGLRPRLLAVVGVAILAFALISSVASFDDARSGREVDFSLDTGGWQSRVTQWKAGLEIYKEHPLVGSGLATFKLHYPRFRTTEDFGTAGNFLHNDYIELLAEGGPMLLAFILAFCGLLIYNLGKRGFRLLKGDGAEVEPVLLIVTMGTTLAHMLLNFPLYQLQVQMLLGLLFARYIAVTSVLSPRTIAVNSPFLARGALIASAVILATVFVLDTVSSELVYDRQRITVVRNIPNNYQLYLKTMSVLSKVRSGYWGNRQLMSMLYRHSFDAQSDPDAKRSLGIAAAYECQSAVELNPYNNGIRKYCAELLQQNPWIEDVDGIEVTAEGLLREGVKIYPVYTQTYMDLADYLKATGREEEAYRLLVDEAMPWMNLKQDNYYNIRFRLIVDILHEAKLRNDTVVLRQLLERI